MSDFLSSLLGSQPRGLFNFIAEIRNAKTKEEEIARVDKELGNIRSKFSNSSTLSSYQKKKYVWKMCYIYMLGYEVDFGHLEFISLLGSSNLTEKSVGYMAVALLLRPGDDLITLVVNCIHNDLVGRDVAAKCLALSTVANLGGNELAEALCRDVQGVIERPIDNSGYNLNSGVDAELDARNRAAVLKKGCLCILRMFRANPDCVDSAAWLHQLAQLLEDRDVGVTTSAMSLLLGFASHNPAPFEPVVPYVVSILLNLVINRMCPQDYLYYRIPCPWLQVKCLRFLQYYKEPEGTLQEQLLEILLKVGYPLSFLPPSLSPSLLCPLSFSLSFSLLLSPSLLVSPLFLPSLKPNFLVLTSPNPNPSILTPPLNPEQLLSTTSASESVNKSNADYSVLFEAMSLVVSYGAEAASVLRELVHSLLGRFVQVADANVRYLALDLLSRLARQESALQMSAYQECVLDALKDGDVSVRKRALDLIYLLTEQYNVEVVVEELINVLSASEASIKDEMVVKIAILAERYYPSFKWYVDTMLQVILVAGDHVASQVWYRVVQVVVNNKDIHEYAAEKMFAAVQSKHCHPVGVSLASYLLGEIGVTICDRKDRSGYDQFAALHHHFLMSEPRVQQIILTTFAKFQNLYSSQAALREDLAHVFTRLSTNSDLELQQRACEYLQLPSMGSEAMERVLAEMPPFPEDKESPLVTLHVDTHQHETSDRAAWKISSAEKEAFASYDPAADARADDQRQHSSLSFSSSEQGQGRGQGGQADLLSLDDSAPAAHDALEEELFGAPRSGGGGGRLNPGPSSPSSPSSLGYGGTTLEPITLPSDQSSELTKRLFNAIVAPAGSRALLYETADVSVSVESRYSAHQGRLSVIVVNKGIGPLSSLSINVPTNLPHLRIQTQPASSEVPALGEAKLLLAVDCMRPYVDCPDMDVSFSLAGRPHMYVASCSSPLSLFSLLLLLCPSHPSLLLLPLSSLFYSLTSGTPSACPSAPLNSSSPRPATRTRTWVAGRGWGPIVRSRRCSPASDPSISLSLPRCETT